MNNNELSKLRGEVAAKLNLVFQAILLDFDKPNLQMINSSLRQHLTKAGQALGVSDPVKDDPTYTAVLDMVKALAARRQDQALALEDAYLKTAGANTARGKELFVKEMVWQVSSLLPMISTCGLTAGTVSYIRDVAHLFLLAKNNVESAKNLSRQEKPNGEKMGVLSYSQFAQTLEPILLRIKEASQKYKDADPTRLMPSSNYPDSVKRHELAKKCLKTGIARAKSSSLYRTLDMVSPPFLEFSHHISVACALLDGDPAKIQSFNLVPGLDAEVYDFMAQLPTVKPSSRPSPKR